MKPIDSLRHAIATGRDCQTVTVRRGHLRWLLAEYDRLTAPRCLDCRYQGPGEEDCHVFDERPGCDSFEPRTPPRPGEAGEAGES